MNILKQTKEKNILLAAAIWQIANGIFTAFIYSFSIRATTLSQTGLSPVEMASAEYLANNFFTLSFTIGILFIVMGIVNIIIRKNLKGNVTDKKIILWFVFGIFLSMFLMDIISILLLIVLVVLLLAKNKAIHKTRIEMKLEV